MGRLRRCGSGPGTGRQQATLIQTCAREHKNEALDDGGAFQNQKALLQTSFPFVVTT